MVLSVFIFVMQIQGAILLAASLAAVLLTARDWLRTRRKRSMTFSNA